MPFCFYFFSEKKALLKFLVSWKVKQTKVTCCKLQRKREKNVNHLVAFGCLDFAWVCKQNQPMIRKARKVFFEIMSHNSKNLLLFEKLFHFQAHTKQLKSPLKSLVVYDYVLQSEKLTAFQLVFLLRGTLCRKVSKNMRTTFQTQWQGSDRYKWWRPRPQ